MAWSARLFLNSNHCMFHCCNLRMSWQDAKSRINYRYTFSGGNCLLKRKEEKENAEKKKKKKRRRRKKKKNKNKKNKKKKKQKKKKAIAIFLAFHVFGPYPWANYWRLHAVTTDCRKRTECSQASCCPASAALPTSSSPSARRATTAPPLATSTSWADRPRCRGRKSLFAQPFSLSTFSTVLSVCSYNLRALGLLLV